jgi:uncharacterized membrane protein YfcA
MAILARSMSASTLRLWLLGLVVAAAVVSFVGSRTGSHVVSSLGFLVFLVAVCLYAIWRRAVSRERAARVFDREAKTDETRTRTDQ